MSKFEEIFDAINRSKNIALFGHINTDGDALGSLLALKFLLENMGKSVDFYSDTDIPDYLDFLPDVNKLNQKNCDSYDLAIALDTFSDRMGIYEKAFYKIKNSVLIDHHTGNENFAKVNWIDPKASSVCFMLYKLADNLKLTITKDVALCLISGILTDTGGLRFSNTDSDTVLAFSKLIDICDMPLYKINKYLFENKSKTYFDVYKRAIQNTEFYGANKIVFIYLKLSDFKELNADYRSVNNLSRIGTELKESGITIVMSESKPNEFHVSLRSNGQYDVRKCAEIFGGGGHVVAAGCKIYGDFETCKERLLKTAMDEIG